MSKKERIGCIYILVGISIVCLSLSAIIYFTTHDFVFTSITTILGIWFMGMAIYGVKKLNQQNDKFWE